MYCDDSRCINIPDDDHGGSGDEVDDCAVAAYVDAGNDLEEAADGDTSLVIFIFDFRDV